MKRNKSGGKFSLIAEQIEGTHVQVSHQHRARGASDLDIPSVL